MDENATLFVPIRYTVLRMIADGEKSRPSCVSKAEWACAKALWREYGQTIFSARVAENIRHEAPVRSAH